MDAGVMQHWPRLTRFYGLSPHELSHTPRVILRIYIEALPGLEAEEQLSRIQASDMAHMESKHRDRVFRRLKWAAGIDDDEPVVLNPHEDANALAALGIGVVIEGA